MDDLKLLMVDDDVDTCSNLADILAVHGYLLDVAYRGQDGLDLLKDYPYRLALLDFKLPCMNGVQLFQRMRRMRGNVRGLLVTGYASIETTTAALAAGFQEIVNKPVDVPKLLELIDKAYE